MRSSSTDTSASSRAKLSGNRSSAIGETLHQFVEAAAVRRLRPRCRSAPRTPPPVRAASAPRTPSTTAAARRSRSRIASLQGNAVTARSPKVARSSRAAISAAPFSPPSIAHPRQVVVADGIAAAAQPGAEDRRQVARRNPPAGEAFGQPDEIAGLQPRLELGQRAQRQAQRLLLAVDDGGDLTALGVGPSQPPRSSVRPALSSARSNVTSPAWSAENSSAVIWNGPSTVPKSGRISCQLRMVPAKNSSRIFSSDAWSLKMPRARDRGALDAAAGQQFAPAPGALGVGDVDRRRVEGERARAQPRHRQKAARPGLVELQQHVLAALGCHVSSSS